MKRTIRFIVPALALAVLFVPSSFGRDQKAADKKPVNLLVNGSFEDGPDLGEDPFKPLDEDSTAIKGWVVTRGQIDYIGSNWQAADGKRSLDLHGSPGFGGVAQTFNTDRGKKYLVTFSLAGSPGLGERKVGVRAAGQKASFAFDSSQTTGDNMGWVAKTWEFTAKEAKTTLEIHTLDVDNNVAGPALDNVSVVEAKGQQP